MSQEIQSENKKIKNLPSSQKVSPSTSQELQKTLAEETQNIMLIEKFLEGQELSYGNTKWFQNIATHAKGVIDEFKEKNPADLEANIVKVKNLGEFLREFETVKFIEETLEEHNTTIAPEFKNEARRRLQNFRDDPYKKNKEFYVLDHAMPVIISKAPKELGIYPFIDIKPDPINLKAYEKIVNYVAAKSAKEQIDEITKRKPVWLEQEQLRAIEQSYTIFKKDPNPRNYQIMQDSLEFLKAKERKNEPWISHAREKLKMLEKPEFEDLTQQINKEPAFKTSKEEFERNPTKQTAEMLCRVFSQISNQQKWTKKLSPKSSKTAKEKFAELAKRPRRKLVTKPNEYVSFIQAK